MLASFAAQNFLSAWPLWVCVGLWIVSICVSYWDERANYRNDLLAIQGRVEKLQGQLIDVEEVDRRYIASGKSRHRRSSCYHVTYIDAAGQRWKILLYAYCGWAGQTENWQIGEVHRMRAAGYESAAVDKFHPFAEESGSRTHRGERPADVPVIFLATNHHQSPAAVPDPSGPRRRHNRSKRD